MKPLSIAIVGCGRIAETHLQAINDLPHLQLAALCDSDSAAAQRLAKQAATSIHICSHHKAMADTVKPDAAIICTPPSTHPEVAIDLIEAGVDILCEKPLAISVEAARAMNAAAARHGKILMMASKFRFVEDIIAARQMIARGEIGEPVQCRLSFCSPVVMNGRWNANAELSGGGVLMDNGPHAADIIRFLFGPITQVQARHGRQIQNIAVEDSTQICFETAGGVLGSIDLSWSVASPTDFYLQISGTNGVIAVGWQHSQWRGNGAREWQPLGNGYSKQQAFAAQLNHFSACVRGESTPQVAPEATLACVEAVCLAYQAAAQRKWMSIKQCCAPFTL